MKKSLMVAITIVVILLSIASGFVFVPKDNSVKADINDAQRISQCHSLHGIFGPFSIGACRPTGMGLCRNLCQSNGCVVGYFDCYDNGDLTWDAMCQCAWQDENGVIW